MPWSTPACSSGPPDRRPRMSDCFGPMFSSTPRISTWNSSTRPPEKTDFPTPRIPGFRPATGKNEVWAASIEARQSPAA